MLLGCKTTIKQTWLHASQGVADLDKEDSHTNTDRAAVDNHVCVNEQDKICHGKTHFHHTD